MKVSLNEMMKLERNKDKSLLLLKKELKELKENGDLFFKEDIVGLQPNHEFQVYFHQMPSKQSEKNPFPILIEDYLDLPNEEEERLKQLTKFFNDYYETNMKKEELKKFHYQAYISNHFVWLYHE